MCWHFQFLKLQPEIWEGIGIGKSGKVWMFRIKRGWDFCLKRCQFHAKFLCKYVDMCRKYWAGLNILKGIYFEAKEEKWITSFLSPLENAPPEFFIYIFSFCMCDKWIEWFLFYWNKVQVTLKAGSCTILCFIRSYI